MLGGIVKTTAKSFLSLQYGLDKTVRKLQKEYIDLISKQKERICKRKNNDLKRRINKIITSLRTILKQIKSILAVLKKILKFVKVVKKILKGLTILVKVLKLFPLPARWALVGMIIKLGDLLSKISSLLKSALLVVLGVDFVISYITRSLGGLVTLIENQIKSLEVVSQQLKDCGADKNKQANDILTGLNLNPNDFLSSLGLNLGDLGGLGENDGLGGEGLNGRILELLDGAALNNNLANGLDSNLNDLKGGLRDLRDQMGELLNSNTIYKGFTFRIIEEEVTDENAVVATRRYATAVNMEGIAVLNGSLSFATDTKVLIDELKLLIDVQEITGYTRVKSSDTSINNVDGNQNEDLSDSRIPEVVNNENKPEALSEDVDLSESALELEILEIINAEFLEAQTKESENKFDEDEFEDESEEDILEDLGFNSEREIETEEEEAQDDLEDLLVGGDKKERKKRQKYERKQTRFVKMLARKAAKGNERAKVLVGRIARKEVKLKDAKSEWYLSTRQVTQDPTTVPQQTNRITPVRPPEPTEEELEEAKKKEEERKKKEAEERKKALLKRLFGKKL